MKYLVSYATLHIIFLANFVSSSVNISAVYDEPATFTKKYDFKHTLHLTCNVTSDTKSVTVRWEKEGKSVTSIDSLKGRIKISDQSSIYHLDITGAGEEDGGNYSCVAYSEDKEVSRAYILAASNIYIKTPDSVNVVEGEKLQITCIVHGNPIPEVTWSFGNDTYVKSRDRIILQEEPDRHIPNAILVIEEVQMSDRGLYTCKGYSNITKKEEKDETMVRIKDKYAALWPFLGICAEVFILCAIILIYEKKRNKTELEESDTDQSPDQKNTPDHAGKDANLRHRQ